MANVDVMAKAKPMYLSILLWSARAHHHPMVRTQCITQVQEETYLSSIMDVRNWVPVTQSSRELFLAPSN